ncbi:MAG: AMP-binding protein [Acidobacteriota bacterium]|jgi:fatty-acyl-CoA synthase
MSNRADAVPETATPAAISVDPWVKGLTIGEALRRRAGEIPDHEAFAFAQSGLRATFAEYDGLVDDCARALIAMGIEPGEHIAVWATNWPQWPLLQLGSARVGAVLVNINPAYRSHELAYALEQSDTRALFLIDRFKSSDYFDILNEAIPELAACEPGTLQARAFPELRDVISLPEAAAPGMSTWNQFLERGRSVSDGTLRAREEAVDPEQAVNLQYTSGTTGFPKGVLLSHRNLLLNAYYVGAYQNLGPQDRVCVPVPFYHCFGCVIGTLSCMVHGVTMLVPAEYFDPVATLDCLEHERATSLLGVPTMFIAQLEDDSFAGRELALRTGIMAGSPCPIEVMNRVVHDMGAAQMTIAYGLTECSPAVTQTWVDDPVEVRVGTVGRSIPGVDVRIEDTDTGATLGVGAQGELCVRGHNVMLGYYKMPEATAATIDADGWLHTGDLAMRDPDGNYRITGRIKDMVIRGGENIYPREIEEFLYTHPDIEDVQVVGVKDERLGEELCACIKLRHGAEVDADGIRDYCKGRLAHFKVPRYVEFVDEFPLTVTGKVQKYVLREVIENRLGINAGH